jgi:hypothetical protein
MRRLPHQGAKHGTIDHGYASDVVFLLLRGCRGRASTSSSTCDRLVAVMAEWATEEGAVTFAVAAAEEGQGPSHCDVWRHSCSG